MPVLRADLHVHTCHSRQSGSLKFLRSRDSYSRPEDVYRTARASGMDLVTFTDHDSIDGCLEFLDRHPGAQDFFISEEVSCRFPGSTIEVHLGVYGMTERLHRELQPLRGHVFEVIAALREAGVFFSLNHLLHFYRGQIPLESYLRVLDGVPALETRNGTMLEAHNALVAAIADAWPHSAPVPRVPLGRVGGSDAHTLRRIGRTWTEVPGTDAASFLEGLSLGLSREGGAHGTARIVAVDAYSVIGSYIGSLLGRGPNDHRGWERAACLLFCAVSAPAQFLPLLIAAAGKAAERRTVASVSGQLSGRLERRLQQTPLAST